MKMGQAADELHRFGVKIFVGPDVELDGRACIPIFHRWIQTKALDGLLIDVADYTHLVNGPKVVLVGHEGNLSVDDGGGRLGLMYTLKRAPAGLLADRLLGVVRTVATAGQLLESAAELGGRVTFLGNELAFMPNDRLLAPSGQVSDEMTRPTIRTVANRLFPDHSYGLSVDAVSRNSITFTVTHPDPLSTATLIERASSQPSS